MIYSIYASGLFYPVILDESTSPKGMSDSDFCFAVILLRNSVVPDQTPRVAASDMVLRLLYNALFWKLGINGFILRSTNKISLFLHNILPYTCIICKIIFTQGGELRHDHLCFKIK